MNPLRQKIEREISEHGPIPFSRYMELCLYDPESGYYSRNAEQFGKAGDFYTSSDVHAVFARLLVFQFEEMWRTLGTPQQLELIELGPGRGLFAQDVLAWSEKKFPDLFNCLRYVLVERSRALRKRIAETLDSYLASGKVILRTEAEGCLFHANTPTIVFANEFFDAMPVEIVSTRGSLRIASGDGRLVEFWETASKHELEFLDRYSVHPEGDERLEVPMIAQRQMQELAASMGRGFLLVIDYGYTREEQLAGRHRGTLKAIRQHSISGSPYESPGDQDITTDVNFTALAAAAAKHGMQTHK
ncbi:MAG: SAM-dependent methyltransferase, partial [Candidatus Sulfotelmatobacter sp.]